MLEDSLAAYRRELGLMDLRDSLAAGSSDARSRALELLRAPGQAYAHASELAAMAAAPAASGRFLRRRANGSWVGAGGIRVPRSARAEQQRRRVRLVAYTDNVELGGADISMSHVLARLDPSIEVTVLGVRRQIVERIAAGRNGSATRIVPRPRSGHDWTSLRAHVRALREIDPDIVHANLSSPWSCQYCIAARRPRCAIPRVVAVYQLAVPPISRAQWRAKRLTARAVDRHVGVGERTSREVENLVGLPAGSVLDDPQRGPRPES